MKLDPKKLIALNRPFAVFVEPGDVIDDELQWFAKVVGFELDNIVYANTPTKALTEVVDLLRLLSGRCTANIGHAWEHRDETYNYCRYCDTLTHKDEFLDEPITP